MAFLQLHGVQVEFGEFVALSGIDLTVEEGKLMCLLGPSGCGKTTTLRVVAGFVEPSQGRVLVDGNDYTKLPAYRRNMGIVFQNYALFPHLTVFENVAFGLRMRRIPSAEIKKKVTEALVLVNLEGMEQRYPSQMSGGQQQRVALARALVIDPDLLLLDEPLSNLDAMLRIRMRSELKELQRQTGITSIFVTHDQDECFSIADEAAVLRDGRIIQVGTPKEILERPRDRFVAEFVGFDNLLRLGRSSDPFGLAYVTASGGVPIPSELIHESGEIINEVDEIVVVFRAQDAKLVDLDAPDVILRGRVAIRTKQDRRDAYIVDTPAGEIKVSGSEGWSRQEGELVGVALKSQSLLRVDEDS